MLRDKLQRLTPPSATCLAILSQSESCIACDQDEFLAIQNGGLIVELRSNHERRRRKKENEPANDQAKTTKLTDFDKIAILEAVNCPCLWKSGESWAKKDKQEFMLARDCRSQNKLHSRLTCHCNFQYLFLKILHCRLQEKLHRVTWP
jgi:hypothetical protein